MGTPAVTTAAASIAAIDMERTLTQLPFWSSLTEHEMETLRRSAFVRHYEKGEDVHRTGNMHTVFPHGPGKIGRAHV